MLIRLMTIAALSVGTMACASAAPVKSGGWQLNPALCPDLREDRRDRAVTTGRRDRREDRRDARVTNCPASAWTWVGPRPRGAKIAAPTYSSIYISKGRYYGVNGHKTVRIVTTR